MVLPFSLSHSPKDSWVGSFFIRTKPASEIQAKNADRGSEGIILCAIITKVTARRTLRGKKRGARSQRSGSRACEAHGKVVLDISQTGNHHSSRQTSKR